MDFDNSFEKKLDWAASLGFEDVYKRQTGITLYAVWSKNSYEVTFDGNGASGSKKTVELKYGQDDILPANTFERPGYTLSLIHILYFLMIWKSGKLQDKN